MITRACSNPGLESLCVRTFGYEQYSEFAHWGRGKRSTWVLHYVLCGEGFFNGARVRTGEGFLIHPNESVEYHPNAENPWQYFWIIFTGNEAQRICERYVPSNKNGIFSYSFGAYLSELIKTLFSENEPMEEAKMLSLFFEIISKHPLAVPDRTNRYVEATKSYIASNLHRPISVRELADMQGICDRYLYNLFVRQEGVSPKQYINTMRIRVAIAMLSQKNRVISEVARSVGFEDALAFSRFFKKHTGTSPSEYKKIE